MGVMKRNFVFAMLIFGYTQVSLAVGNSSSGNGGNGVPNNPPSAKPPTSAGLLDSTGQQQAQQLTQKTTANKDTADSNGASANIGKIVEMAIGTALTVQGVTKLARKPPDLSGLVDLAMAAKAFAESAQMGKTAGDSANLADNISYNPTGPSAAYDNLKNNLPAGSGVDLPSDLAGFNSKTEQAKAELVKAGYLDSNGNLTAKAASASGSAGSGIGLPDATTKALEEAGKKALANLTGPSVSQMALASPGGGSGDSSSTIDEYNPIDRANDKKNGKKVDPNARAREIAGMTTFVGDTALGTAGANIFEMIRRRYDLKKHAGLFVDL